MTEAWLARGLSARPAVGGRAEIHRTDGRRLPDGNEQAMQQLLAVADAILVVGSRQSSNANRMVEVAPMQGGRAYLVDSLADVEPSMLSEVHALGLTASASAPDWLIEEIVEAFVSRGAAVELLKLKEERIHFPLPKPPAD